MDDVRALTTDGVVVMDGKVVLLERNHPPCEGMWVLPGGYVDSNETAREACMREVREEIGLEVTTDEFVGLFDDPDRDQRGNVSAAYRCSPVDNTRPEPREEATRIQLCSPDELPEMGFDHARIVASAFDGE